MKKVFITIVLLFYVAAGVGFGSMQHDCLLAENHVLQENDCCHAESDSKHKTVCHLVEKPSAENHADGSPSSLKPGCCEIQYTFVQLESASLLVSVDLPQVAGRSSGEIIFYPHTPQLFEGCDITIFADPSNQLNLPLLN